MASSVLFRWSGLAFIVGGVLTAVAVLFHPTSDDPAAMASAAWMPVHVLIGLGIVVLLFGMMGAYARQAEEAGALGLVGFVMAFSGTVLFGGIILFLDGLVFPVLASGTATRGLLDMSGPLLSGPLNIVFLLASLDFGLGYILFGIATWMAGVFPRWAGALLVIGAPFLALTPPLPVYGAMVGAVILGISAVWIGYELWTEGAETAPGGIRPAA